MGTARSLSDGGWCAERKQRDIFPTVRRLDWDMMLMNGEKRRRHLASWVGGCSAASPYRFFLELTGRAMRRYASVYMDGLERNAFGWLGLCA